MTSEEKYLVEDMCGYVGMNFSDFVEFLKEKDGTVDENEVDSMIGAIEEGLQG